MNLKQSMINVLNEATDPKHEWTPEEEEFFNQLRRSPGLNQFATNEEMFQRWRELAGLSTNNE